MAMPRQKFFQASAQKCFLIFGQVKIVVYFPHEESVGMSIREGWQAACEERHK
jgi:hypothetical protein